MGGLTATAKNMLSFGHRSRKPREDRKKKAIRRLSKDEISGIEEDIGAVPGSLRKRGKQTVSPLGGEEELL